MQLIAELLISIIESYLLLKFFDAVVGSKDIDRGYRFFISIIYAIVMVLIRMSSDYNVLNGVGPFIVCFVYGLRYKYLSIWQNLVVSFAARINLLVINGAFAILDEVLKDVPGLITESNYLLYWYTMILLTKVLFLLECIYYQKFSNYNYSVDTKVSMWNIVYSICVMSIMLYLFNQYTLSAIDIRIVILIFFGTIFGNVYINLLTQNLTSTKRENERNLLLLDIVEKEKTLLSMMQEKSDELSKMKHDHYNHLLAIKYMVHENDISSAEKYLDSLEVKDIPTSLGSNSRILNYIMNSKIDLAKSKGIDVKYEISGEYYDYIDIVDMNIILGNLMDNAIEGVVGTKNQYIQIQLEFNFPDISKITVKNTSTAAQYNKQGNILSRKRNYKNEGMGIKGIEERLMRYKGENYYGYQDGIFSHLCILYNIDEFKE